MYEHLLSNISLLCFAISAVLHLVSFQKDKSQGPLAVVALVAFILGTGSITGSLVTIWGEGSLVGLSGIFLTATIGWLAVLGHFLFRMRLIGAFVAPLLTLILMVQFFLAPTGAEIQTTSSTKVLILVHVAMAVLGMAFGIIACAVSILFLWQQNLLKKKLLAQIPSQLPAIDKLNKHLSIALWAGFIFLTLSVLSGAIFTQTYKPRATMDMDFKIIWAIIVWIWYLAILLSKIIFNRPGKQVAQMSLAGFLLLALTYFGMGV